MIFWCQWNAVSIHFRLLVCISCVGSGKSAGFIMRYFGPISVSRFRSIRFFADGGTYVFVKFCNKYY